jgi:KDO2-lipid IV(A) lauroyltransferase
VRRQSIAFWLGKVIIKVSKKTRLRAMKNIANALPELSMQQREEILTRSYQTIVFGVLESFWLSDLENEIDILCDEHTLSLLQNKEGASVASMHMSCYEMAPFALQQLTWPITTLSKIPSYIKSAKNIYDKANIQVINKNSDNYFLKLLQASRNKSVICLHSDHYANDVKINFFNKKTGAPNGAAIISAYSKVPLLLCYPILQKNGRYKVYIETVNANHVKSNKTDIDNATQAIYQRFEEIILQHPNQWYWSYNRWRD